MAETQIAGTVQPGFEGVREAFTANFSRDGDDREVGAALAVYVRGRCVVDLWGGHADAAEAKPWARDTLINVWSASKGVVAIALAMLVDQGRVSYDDKVAKHWPEFAAGGKADITVGQLVSHQGGLNGFAEPAMTEDLFDWALSTGRLAAQTPFCEPGTAASYHAITFGFLVGEVVRRVTGQDVGGFIRDALAGPLGADFHIGLQLAQDWRVGEIIGPGVAGAANAIGVAGQSAIAARAVSNPRPEATTPNRRDWRAAWAHLCRDRQWWNPRRHDNHLPGRHRSPACGAPSRAGHAARAAPMGGGRVAQRGAEFRAACRDVRAYRLGRRLWMRQCRTRGGNRLCDEPDGQQPDRQSAQLQPGGGRVRSGGRLTAPHFPSAKKHLVSAIG